MWRDEGLFAASPGTLALVEPDGNKLQNRCDEGDLISFSEEAQIRFDITSRGLNTSSTASEACWDWSDFTGQIDLYIDIHGRNPNLEQHKSSRDRLWAQKGFALTYSQLAGVEHYLNVLINSCSFEYLTYSGCAFFERLMRCLYPLALHELDTGIDCRIETLHGVAEIAYSRILRQLKTL